MKIIIRPILILSIALSLFLNLSSSAQDLRFGLSFDIGMGNRMDELDNMEFVWNGNSYIANPGKEDFFLKFASTANLEYLNGRNAFMLESGAGGYHAAWNYYNMVFDIDTSLLRISKTSLPVYLKYGYLFGDYILIQPFAGIGFVHHFNYKSNAELEFGIVFPLYFEEESLYNRLAEDVFQNTTEFLLVTGVEFIFPSALKLSLNYEYKLVPGGTASFNHIGTLKITRTISLLHNPIKKRRKLLKYLKYED